jgi:L-aspartate oxidase
VRVVVIGGGIAGCAAALSAARGGAEVSLLTKLPDPGEANTRYAQGGIIYTGPGDSPELLVEDVIRAGAGVGDREAARLLAAEGPPLVERVLVEEAGVPFDREDGGLHLTREGAHSVNRVAHRSDTTGAAIHEPLIRAVCNEERVELLAGARALDLAVADGRCAGVHVAHEGGTSTVGADAVILATGGLGALYEHTTNPPSATGDGVAMALRAGAEVRDLHYVQFHPTALYAPGERFLISEAVRGEGGVLRDPDGEEFADPLGPRDVVAREIAGMMQRTGSPCAYLDASHLPEEWLRRRFPAIHARCQAAGIDVASQPIPVVPAAHYSCGGVAADACGRTTLPGLWAAGEAASTGLHGANRLASTSLLEGLVWGWRSGEDAARTESSAAELPPSPGPLSPASQEAWRKLRALMWDHAGLIRTAEGLAEGLGKLRGMEREYADTELSGPLLVARRIMEAALADGRSRGCHYRRDAEGRGRVNIPG